jgi:hypothetical protein
MNGIPCDYLAGIREIRDAVLDMNGISNKNKKTILTYMASMVSNGWYLGRGEDAEDMLRTAPLELNERNINKVVKSL